ncbi:MAG: rhodanese-like domain-containing protein [Candidatus Aenigmarchaeota archaeon]|nr:rhodanese-like domain-containing protein [Candidatus Aenigmarchaeota archaeon]
MNALTTGELKKMMESREDFVLVDVLSKKYYKQQHIKGAVNIPLSEGNFKRSVSRTITDKNKKIVVYCASLECMASPTAAKTLDMMGYKNVFDYESGIKDWIGAGLPIENTSNENKQ